MKPFLLLALLIPAAAEAAPRLSFLTFGPMMHINFGANGRHFTSWGVEGAYWSYRRGIGGARPDTKTPGWGAAVGFEADGNSLRYHLEPQIGWVYAGLSLGAVLETPREGGAVHAGFQGSSWLNAFLGYDVRYRRVDGRSFLALGQYVKIGALVAGE